MGTLYGEKVTHEEMDKAIVNDLLLIEDTGTPVHGVRETLEDFRGALMGGFKGTYSCWSDYGRGYVMRFHYDSTPVGDFNITYRVGLTEQGRFHALAEGQIQAIDRHLCRLINLASVMERAA